MRATEFASPVQDVLSRLRKVRQSGDGSWSALCPSHDDTNPSLSVGIGEDGRVLLKCHAGCPPENIVGALGLSMADLHPRRNESRDGAGHERRMAAHHAYHAPHGQVLFEVVR